MIDYTMNIGHPGGSIYLARFWELVRRFDLYHWSNDRWPCHLSLLPDELTNEGSELNEACRGEGSACLFQSAEDSPAAILCWLGGGYVDVKAAAGTREAALTAMGWAREFLPSATRNDPGRIPITFWLGERHGVSSLRRMLDVPSWSEIEANYWTRTRQELGQLMAGFEPAKGGQLLLFYGEAGTGKTFALRALGSEWRSWCDIDYVIDPDRFLGEAKYLVEVLLARREEWEEGCDPSQLMHELLSGRPLDGEASQNTENSGRWRLIMLEDTGELLSADAKERTGQSLSRLLNTVDGLIGQGLRTLILVTTNEPIRELHPAVARAGRCAAAIEFCLLSPAEGAAWLGQGVSQPITIADLYALRDGYRGGEAQPWPELPEEGGLPQGKQPGGRRPQRP